MTSTSYCQEMGKFPTKSFAQPEKQTTIMANNQNRVDYKVKQHQQALNSKLSVKQNLIKS